MKPSSNLVLYVIHKREWDDTRIADALAAAGYEVTFCCPAEGDGLPASAADFAGVVLGGGLHSVNEAHRRPYLAEEIAWTWRSVDAGVPVFGICLGSQILAAAFGGRCAASPDGRVEYGFYPIRPTRAGRPWLGGLGHVFQSHYESVVELPHEAALLATGEHFRVQAFAIGPRAIGVQFHPDARLDMMAAWCDECAGHLERPGAQTKAEQLRLAARHEVSIQGWLERFVARWLNCGEDRQLCA
jgi:GMP synthase (glutamine-hydrolysing)